jgi:hypothetical protein
LLHKNLCILLIFTILCIQATYAEDDIQLTFRQAQIGQDHRFWNGEGYLRATGGTAEIRRYSSNLNLVDQDKDKIILSHKGPAEFEICFLTGRPGGHGYYEIDEVLPTIGDRRHIIIEIENGDRLLYSNINWSVEKGGSYLTLEGYTDQDHLQLIYITKFANMAFTNAFAAAVFLGLLLAYLLYRRKAVRSRINMNLRRAKDEGILPFKYESSNRGYRITYLQNDAVPDKAPYPAEGMGEQTLRDDGSASSSHPSNPSVFIPSWLVSCLIMIVLMIIFIQSLFRPFMPVWDQLGVLRYGIILGGLVYAVLSMIFISSASSQKEQLARVGIIGGGIVWIMFSYLGWIALLLGGCTALLIYLLSILVMEGEDETSSDDTSL